MSRILGMFSTDMGIDLGTCNTLVTVQGQGIVLAEPSVVAVRKGTNKVLMGGKAVGAAAKEMLGRAPPNIDAIRPMKDGVIADFEIAEAMIRYFIDRVHNRKWGVRPRVVIAVPSGITGVERRAVHSAAERAGARKVYLVEEPRAAGIGAGLPIDEPVASMVVDVGGGTTEIAVLALADVVISESIRVAGDDMDEAIAAHVRKEHQLLIGEPTAERIKISIGSAHPLERELQMSVKGRDTVSGMPRGETVTSEEMREALSGPIETIYSAIRKVLEQTPPELSADLVDRGILLCGGGALLRGLDRAMSDAINLPVRLADDPLICVAIGTGLFLENLDKFSDVLDAGDR
ncbi:MAG: rod shape-determining protein [Planctomycetota bacterium]|nr:rod shape-determining protein [Planctomycetota bacterium]